MDLKQENIKLKASLLHLISVCRWIVEKVEIKGITGEIVKDYLSEVVSEIQDEID